MAETVEGKIFNIDEKLKGIHLAPGSDAVIATSFNLSELAAVEMNVCGYGNMGICRGYVNMCYVNIGMCEYVTM